MSRTLKTSIVAVLITLTGGGIYFGYRYFWSPEIPEVDAEPILRRNLQALVSASGTIQPQLTVDISANVMGRVTQLSVNEGDRVVAGQFLLQIDPESLQSVVERGEASLEASSRYLAKEVGPDNIRVNVISPGAIRTLSSAGIKDFAELMRVAGEHSAMKRTASQDEVAQTAVFLASEASSGITGQVIYVDCGYSIMAN